MLCLGTTVLPCKPKGLSVVMAIQEGKMSRLIAHINGPDARLIVNGSLCSLDIRHDIRETHRPLNTVKRQG